jgi:hypothetical protein
VNIPGGNILKVFARVVSVKFFFASEVDLFQRDKFSACNMSGL